MNFRGNAIVFKNATRQRNEHGAWTTTFYYEGVSDVLRAYAGTIGSKAKIEIQEDGATSQLGITFGNINDVGQEVVAERWEIDTEILEKDLKTSEEYQSLSIQAAQEFERWFQDKNSELDTTADGTDGGAVIMGKFLTEFLRGVESYQTETFILKRTRTMSADYATPFSLQKKKEFYTTSRLIDLESMPLDVAGMLPIGDPYAPPDQSAWGWLPRLRNRTFVGNGQVEETCDWVYAAWSTFLYTLVS